MMDCPRCKEQPEIQQGLEDGYVAICNGCYDGAPDSGIQMYVTADDKRDLAMFWNDLVTDMEGKS